MILSFYLDYFYYYYERNEMNLVAAPWIIYVASISRRYHHAGVRGAYAIADDAKAAEAAQGEYSGASVLRRRGRLRGGLGRARDDGGDLCHLGYRFVLRKIILAISALLSPIAIAKRTGRAERGHAASFPLDLGSNER